MQQIMLLNGMRKVVWLVKVKNMTCIRCPLGCALTVSEQENGLITVTGNTCPKGQEYGIKEMTNPTRTVTSTVRVKGVKNKMVSVKTSSEIPKEKIMKCMEELTKIEVVPPIHVGDIIVENIAGTEQSIIATKTVP